MAALLQADLVDRLVWFQAPGIIGGDGLAAVAPLGLEALAAMPRYHAVERAAFGADGATTLVRPR